MERQPTPIDILPFFAGLDAETRQRVVGEARRITLPAGAHVFEPGQSAKAFLIVEAGIVRVQLTAQNGREIVLYRVAPGDSCVLTTSCLLDSDAYAAAAICETEVRAIALPRAAFRRLLDAEPAFRDAVLAAYAGRVADLILTIEETRLHRVDARLAALLAERALGGRVTATHQDLATELGTAREVVSRTLKRFERSGAVTLGRGQVEIRDRALLASHAREV
jgi:CRP/FNR family transcriptional regulator